MKTLAINWLAPCPHCGNDTAMVKTEKGDKDWLYDGDAVTCMSTSCGMKGVIEIFDADSADVVWDEIGLVKEQPHD